MRLDPAASFRVSKRGLVLAGAGGDTVLFEHPRAAELPVLLQDDPIAEALAERLGQPLGDGVFGDLVALRILTDAETGTPGVDAGDRVGVALTTSGLMVPGIARPARGLNRYVTPLVVNPVGRLALIALVAAGIAALVAGRPELPSVSAHPALEAVLMIVIGLAATVGHELAHAVALVHYGVPPRRAGFGFYWGSISFFVDSTPALTLPRRARVIQALAGLGVDAVTVSIFAIAAHLIHDQLLAIVLWRLAILGVLEIAVNLAPILQVDGHWALADFLDEPDLGPRARRALSAALRRRLPPGQGWLAGHGLFSLLVGLAMLAVMVIAYWATVGALIADLFAGNVAEIALGVYYVAPVALGVTFSGLGLILETVWKPDS